MSDRNKTLNEWLKEDQIKLEGVMEKFKPLEQEVKHLEQNIRQYKFLISSEENPDRITRTRGETTTTTTTTPKKSTSTHTVSSESLTQKYKELIPSHFLYNSFREKEIREFADSTGFRIRGKLISSSYSRAVLFDLVQENFLEKPEIGLYRLKRIQSSGEAVSDEEKDGLLL